MKSGLVLALGFVATTLSAQAPPSTDVWVVPLTTNGAKASLGAARNLTMRVGYDNQPAWSPRGDVVYFSSLRGDGQNDIWSVGVADGKQERITRTAPESEYSPTVFEGGASLSVVRVERDSAQRLWRIPLDGGVSSVILENIKPVGYHAWGDSNTLGLFVLGSPNSFQIADVRRGTATIVSQRIGRAVAKIPGANAISFVDKSGGEEWWITRYDLATGTKTQIARSLPGVEDYAWTPGGLLLAANDARVFQWTATAGWAEIADLSGAGVVNITRMAVSPRGDLLAFVAADKSS